MEIKELAKCMLELFQNSDREMERLKREEERMNLRQQDLLHYIENNNLNAFGYAKVGKVLKGLRKQRRGIKNKKEVQEIVRRFTTKYNNKMIQGDLIQIIKELNQLEEKQKNPTYSCRTDILQKSGLIEERKMKLEQVQEQKNNS